MDSYGYVFDEEWMNLGSIFSCDQADSNQFTGHGLFSSEHGHGLNLESTPIFCPISSNESNSSDSRDHILSYPSDDLDLKYSKCYNDFSQESSSATDSPPQYCHDVFPFSLSKTHMDNVYDQSNDLLCVAEGDSSNFLLLAQIFSDDAMEEILCLKQDEVDVKGKKENSASQLMHIADLDRQTSLKRKYEILVELPNALEEANSTQKNNENPKKKTRVARDNKPKKSSPPKKNQKKMMTVINSNEDDGDQESNIHDKNEKGRGNVQISSSCCSSEGDSQDVDGGATNNVTAKTRAGRGAATDPQSIYARKRRERINERLKILQTLVPNGTKVDISTMLEEAVHYVKFLQLQIKLLSSDDTWMYAPIAYNGMDMGLYQNISP